MENETKKQPPRRRPSPRSRAKGKNIVICYDGTGNEYGTNNTNVVKVIEALKPEDEAQIACYDPGVGTFVPGKNKTWLGKCTGTLAGQAFGRGLQQNLGDGYRFLMRAYSPGDRLFVFGFSRGAFTARSLLGMIHHFGVLRRGCQNLVPYVLRMYTKGLKKDDAKSVWEGFKHTFSHSCEPHFIGIWDSVSSLGYLTGKQFFDHRLNPDVRHAYHAISIDEKRRKFPVGLWDESRKTPEQRLEQVWFSGVHSDVGGYYEDCGLSDISFAWMMDKAEEAGLQLRKEWRENLRPNPEGDMHESYVRLWRICGKKPRQIPEGALIHASVFDRINAEGLKYAPNLPEKHEKTHTTSYETNQPKLAEDG